MLLKTSTLVTTAHTNSCCPSHCLRQASSESTLTRVTKSQVFYWPNIVEVAGKLGLGNFENASVTGLACFFSTSVFPKEAHDGNSKAEQCRVVANDAALMMALEKRYKV